MNYTFNITSKGQITIPKEFREKLGLDTIGQATISLQDDHIVMTAPKGLKEVRALLNKPSGKDKPSERELLIGGQLAKKYGVR